MPQSLATPDPWSALRKNTSARIALGRAGGSLPTREVLDFAQAHAAARDAVHAAVDFDQVAREIKAIGHSCLMLKTQAADRETYLQRPDLGRRLDAASAEELRSATKGDIDLALIVGDGLSAPAAQTQAAPLLAHLVPLLHRDERKLSPISLVRHARVAVEDEIGQILGARLALILLGERPGLQTDQSLGAYLVYEPRAGRTDAQRNCVSNIRPDGLAPAAAAETLHYLMTLALQRQLSGVLLKDERALFRETPATQLR